MNGGDIIGITLLAGAATTLPAWGLCKAAALGDQILARAEEDNVIDFPVRLRVVSEPWEAIGDLADADVFQFPVRTDWPEIAA